MTSNISYLNCKNDFIELVSSISESLKNKEISKASNDMPEKVKESFDLSTQEEVGYLESEKDFPDSSSLDELPLEMLLNIFSGLDIKSLYRMQAISTYFGDAARKDPRVMKNPEVIYQCILEMVDTIQNFEEKQWLLGKLAEYYLFIDSKLTLQTIDMMFDNQTKAIRDTFLSTCIVTMIQKAMKENHTELAEKLYFKFQERSCLSDIKDQVSNLKMNEQVYSPDDAFTYVNLKYFLIANALTNFSRVIQALSVYPDIKERQNLENKIFEACIPICPAEVIRELKERLASTKKEKSFCILFCKLGDILSKFSKTSGVFREEIEEILIIVKKLLSYSDPDYEKNSLISKISVARIYLNKGDEKLGVEILKDCATELLQAVSNSQERLRKYELAMQACGSELIDCEIKKYRRLYKSKDLEFIFLKKNMRLLIKVFTLLLKNNVSVDLEKIFFAIVFLKSNFREDTESVVVHNEMKELLKIFINKHGKYKKIINFLTNYGWRNDFLLELYCQSESNEYKNNLKNILDFGQKILTVNLDAAQSPWPSPYNEKYLSILLAFAEFYSKRDYDLCLNFLNKALSITHLFDAKKNIYKKFADYNINIKDVEDEALKVYLLIQTCKKHILTPRKTKSATSGQT